MVLTSIVSAVPLQNYNYALLLVVSKFTVPFNSKGTDNNLHNNVFAHGTVTITN